MSSTHHICTQPSLLNSRRLSILRLGLHEVISPRIIDRPFGTPDYLIMLFHDPAVIGMPGGVRHCASNTFMVWEPGRPHYYGNRAAPWEHSWVHLTGSCVRRALDQSGVARNEPIQLAGAYVVDRYLQALFAEVSGYPNPDGVILERLIECWMRELARALRPPSGPVTPVRLLEVKQYLETHVAQPQRLPDLAARACLSVPHFCSQFKRYFGVSAIEYVLGLRMQHAAFLLRDMTMSAKEVARAAGYQDIYYFSKLFKKHHGVGPRAFRQRMARDSARRGDKDAGRPQTTGPRRRATKRNAENA